MAGSRKQNYMHGAAILTVGVIIMKVLGFIYKVPLGNILGDEGYSMFMGAYSIYNIFFTLATAGLPVALSRLVAEADANGRVKQEEKTFRVALGTFAVIGVLFSFVLIPTTVDEVLEVLFKVISGLILASALLRARKPLPVGSAGAILGVSIGSVVSLGYMVIYKRRHYDALAGPYTAGVVAANTGIKERESDSVGKIVHDLLTIGVPIALGACIMAILNSVDSKLCMNRLQTAAHFSYREAKVLYGVYGKAQTFFNLPAAFITPLTISIVPAISGAFARGEARSAAKISEDSMRISAVIAMPMGIGLSVMSMPIMDGFYAGSHHSGPALLAIMGVASIFVCLLLMENAVLQASGREKYTMVTMIVGGLVKILVNWVLVARRPINIYGAPVGTLVSYIVMCVMNFAFMSSTLERTPHLGRILFKPALCSGVMGLAAWACFGLGRRLIHIPGRVGLLGAMLVAVIAAVVVYVVCVVALRAITREDLALIPKGEKIASLLHIK